MKLIPQNNLNNYLANIKATPIGGSGIFIYPSIK